MSYKPGDAVMVKTEAADRWHVGIVIDATDMRSGWTKAEARNHPSYTVFSHWTPDCIRVASAEDLASLPDWARDWLTERLLDHHNPQVPSMARPALIALRGAGIHRLSDLKEVSDGQLLALKGVGRKCLLQLREWQRAKDSAAVEPVPPLLVTEGAKKAAALLTAGMTTAPVLLPVGFYSQLCIRAHRAGRDPARYVGELITAAATEMVEEE